MYTQALAYLMDLPVVQAWPEFQDVLKRAELNEPHGWVLPGVTCEAVGGTLEQAIPAIAAVGCLQISIILIDDLLDDDSRGEYRRIGAPAAANLAAAFQAAGLEAIAQSEVDPETRLAALYSLNQMALTTAHGQHLDVQNPADEASYWRLVQTKSSPFYGAALHAGALLGGAVAETAEQLKRLGHLYGEMIQIHDDLNDTMEIPANPDWSQGRAPLPILFAQTVEHPGRARFLELQRVIPEDLGALTEAQEILIRCGAVSYCVDQLLHRHRRAQELLADAQLTYRAGLETLLEEIIDPVWELFRAIGDDESELLLNIWVDSGV